MTAWDAAAGLVVAALALCALACVRGRAIERAVAVQLGPTLLAFLLAVLAHTLRRDYLLDAAIFAVLLGFCGTIAFSYALERWL